MVVSGGGAYRSGWWSGAVCAGAVGLAIQGDDLGVVDESVDGGCGEATTSSPRVSPQRENARFEVTTTDPVS